MSEPKTAEVKVADLAEFMRTGSGRVALSREIIAEIERLAKSQKVKADGLTGEARASLYSCPAATQSLLKDEGLDLFAWLCDESSDAIAAQAGAAFLGDWSICSASLMRDPYSARPYVLFYVEAEAKAAPASPPAETGEGEAVAWRYAHPNTPTDWRVTDHDIGKDWPNLIVQPLYTHPASDQSDTERMRALVEALAEALFTADRLRKRVTPDLIGMPSDVKDEWRARAAALAEKAADQ